MNFSRLIKRYISSSNFRYHFWGCHRYNQTINWQMVALVQCYLLPYRDKTSANKRVLTHLPKGDSVYAANQKKKI